MFFYFITSFSGQISIIFQKFIIQANDDYFIQNLLLNIPFSVILKNAINSEPEFLQKLCKLGLTPEALKKTIIQLSKLPYFDKILSSIKFILPQSNHNLYNQQSYIL